MDNTWKSAPVLIRQQAVRDMLASIEEFWRASGPDRIYWRRTALWHIRHWREAYATPERQAFMAAVAASRRAR